jgi:2-dehydropantoate 2-reductase
MASSLATPTPSDSDRPTHYVVYGAGGIGATIGARLHRQSFKVTLIARGEHGRALQESGLHFIAPDCDEVLQIPTVLHPREIHFDDNVVVLMCMKSQHGLAALEDLAQVAPVHTPIVCVQNGVDNERQSLRFFPNVYASVVILPAVFLQPGLVVSHAANKGGILDTGCYPQGLDNCAEKINADFTAAGFSAHPDPRVMRQKYAKLLINLANVLQAGLQDATDARDISQALRNEALACFAVANIDCMDNSEAKRRRDGVMLETHVPGHDRSAGSSWQSMQRGTGDIETNYLKGEIVLLGRLHGVPTPANAACVAMATQMLAENLGPGAYSADWLRAKVAELGGH